MSYGYFHGQCRNLNNCRKSTRKIEQIITPNQIWCDNIKQCRFRFDRNIVILNFYSAMKFCSSIVLKILYESEIAREISFFLIS